ncbi:lysophospholipase [Macrococcus armenti]|uniref:alpha/beta fold hydrolase n=1 Tax=Macrococcus armenti TaxID=2875764 RepID=UPI001CCC7509|nr:alpha/beta fold hydrolase [Macrococcus armenti]UBH23337.1 lysophospholipase [Macrococcus armenti]
MITKKLITLKDNTRIEYKLYRCNDAKGVIQMLHGMAEHMERYEPVCKYFNDLGYDVLIHNHRGHGENIDEKLRGHFPSVDTLVKDAYEIFETFAFKGEHVLFGHSMGSIVARKYVIQYPGLFDKLILSGTSFYNKKFEAASMILKPLLKIHPENKKLDFVNMITLRDFNKSFKPLRTESDWLSFNEDNVDAFINDPYTGFNMSIGALNSINESLKYVSRKQNVKRMNKSLKVLLVAGNDDPFSNFGKGVIKTGKLFKSCGITHVYLQLYEHARHEVLFERNQREVLNNMRKWLSYE